jgi:transcriptional regulator with XRE-family HTH domain
VELDREVIRCRACGLVQYRTRGGNCRRCRRLLPPHARQLCEKWPNRVVVENIGQRIRQLRKSRGLTQTQLQTASCVSKASLSRIENGQIMPGLGTLEKISEGFGVRLNLLFVPETNGETLLEDPFIEELRPFVRRLDWKQWQWILKRLAAISRQPCAIVPLNACLQEKVRKRLASNLFARRIGCGGVS